MTNVLVLNTGLFPDARTVSAALRQLAETHRVETMDIRHRDGDDATWDRVVAAIVAADLVVSV